MGTIKVLVVAGLLLCTLLCIVLISVAKDDPMEQEMNRERQLDKDAETIRKNQTENLDNKRFEEQMRSFDANDKAQDDFNKRYVWRN